MFSVGLPGSAPWPGLGHASRDLVLAALVALAAAIAQPPGGPRSSSCRRLRDRIIEGVRYPRELRRLDDPNLGRGDLPGLARRHAREEAGRAQHRVARRKP